MQYWRQNEIRMRIPYRTLYCCFSPKYMFSYLSGTIPESGFVYYCNSLSGSGSCRLISFCPFRIRIAYLYPVLYTNPHLYILQSLIRIVRINIFLPLPDPEALGRGMVEDPQPFITKQRIDKKFVVFSNFFIYFDFFYL